VIEVKNISKTFKLYSSPAHRLKEIVLRKSYHKNYQALDNVSFQVAAGETLGILGPNGAGKSTLLKLLTGILLPDQGNIQINGRVTGLLELGTGFNPDLTGRANIAMNGALLGMTQAEINTKEQLILDFAEIGIFIDEPLSTYSSGMIMRLAFAIAINADPQCFIIDEALSVGDAGFQQKCMARIREFKQQGGAIIFVSHDMDAVKKLCDQAILLNKGKIVAQGKPDEIVNQYNRLLSTKNKHHTDFVVQEGKTVSYGTLEAVIKEVSIDGHRQGSVIVSGDEVVIAIQIEAHVNMDKLAVGIIIRDKYGQDIFGTNTYHHQQELSIKAGLLCTVEYRLAMNIGVGKYTIGAAIHAIPTEPPRRLNWADNLMEFEVIAPAEHFFMGLSRLQPQIKIVAADV